MNLNQNKQTDQTPVLTGTMLVFFSRLGLSTMSKVENTLTNLQIKLNQMILPNKIIWKTMTVCSGMTNGNQFFLILLNFFKSLFKKRTRVNQSLNSQIKETLTWLSVSQPFTGLRAPSNKINLKVVKFWRIILNHKMLITVLSYHGLSDYYTGHAVYLLEPSVPKW